jgi:hypothetical protein
MGTTCVTALVWEILGERRLGPKARDARNRTKIRFQRHRLIHGSLKGRFQRMIGREKEGEEGERERGREGMRQGRERGRGPSEERGLGRRRIDESKGWRE